MNGVKFYQTIKEKIHNNQINQTYKTQKEKQYNTQVIQITYIT